MSDYCDAMGNVMLKLSDAMGIERPLFCLLIMSRDNDDKIGQYVSNVHRGGMVKALREFLDQFENNEDTPREEQPG